MVEFIPGAADEIVKLLKKHNLDQEVFLGNKTELLKDMDLKDLAEFGLAWGKLSSQGLVCGILGCNTPVEIRCETCQGGYCMDHKDWHSHSENSDGIIEKEIDEL